MRASDVRAAAVPTGLRGPGLTVVGDFVSPSWRPARLDRFLTALGEDILALNLEGPVVACDREAVPRQRVKYNIASARAHLPPALRGRTIWCTANNHFEDFAPEQRVGLDAIGLIEAGSRARPAVELEIGGRSVVLAPLSLPAPDPGRWRSAAHSIMLSPHEALAHLARLRAAHPRALLAALVHWGYEFQTIPFPADRAWARRALAAGVDMVVGNHAHVLQPVERMGEGIIAYSLGNFYFPSGAYFGRPCVFPDAARRSLALNLSDGGVDVLELSSRERDGDVEVMARQSLDASPHLARFSGLTDQQYAAYFREQRALGQAPMPLGIPVVDDYGATANAKASAFLGWQDVRQHLRNCVYRLRDGLGGRERPATPPPRRRPRVLITHQGCVPIYRKPLFDRLARFADVDYVVAHGQPPRGTGYMVAAPPYAFAGLPIKNHELAVGPATLIWQPLVVPFWRDFDAVVLGDEIKYVSHLALLAAARLRRRPVIFWGFGYPSGDKDVPRLPLRGRAERAAKAMFRRLILRSIDGYLAYTASGRDALIAAGLPADCVVTVDNTVDIERERALAASVRSISVEACRSRLGVSAAGPVLLYFGRLRPTKHVDVLVRYAKYCARRNRPVNVIISGIGESRDALQAEAAGASGIVFCELDDGDLALALRTAAAVVIPGYAGLAIPHAFAHGVPFLTRHEIEHPPEIDYLEDGVNGLMLPFAEQAFFDALDRYLDDAQLQERLRRGAHESASRLSMDVMAGSFDGLVRRLLARRGLLAPSGPGQTESVP